MSQGSGEGLPPPTTSGAAQLEAFIRSLRVPVDEAIAQGKVGTPEIYDTMNTVFPLLFTMGFVDEAVRLCRDAMVVSARALWTELVQMTTYGRRIRLRDHRTQVDQFLSNVLDIFPGSGEAAGLALEVLLWRRHFGMEIERLGRTQARDDPQRNGRLSELADYRRLYAESIPFFPAYEDQFPPRPRLETRIFLDPVSSRPELDELWTAAFSDQSFDQYADRFPPATARQVAERLPPGSVLIEYWRTERFLRDAPSEPRYLVIALESGEEPRAELVDLCPASALEGGLLSDYLSALTGEEVSVLPPNLKRNHTTQGSSQEQARELGGRLREVVYDRLPAFARESQHMLIVPDGYLFFVPFAALPQGSNGYLIDDHLISYLQSGRDIYQASPKRPTRSPVVMCAPDYEAMPSDAAPPESPLPEWAQTLRWPPLPWSAAEGESVATLLGVSPIEGDDANESALRACVSPSVLHLATHGAILPAQWQTAEISALHASDAPVDQRGVSRFHEGLGRLGGHLVPYQEVRSVLALAGANSWLDGVDLPVRYGTGHVNAEGLLDIDLGGTELVVLSACETALGNLYHDEGVVGIRSSLRLAGARTLVIALWTVPDQDTRDLMVLYYSNLLKEAGKAEGLRQAQLAMRKRFPLEPYRWGGFVSEGETGPMEFVAPSG
jgi:CHAT domain-containing protein